MYGYYSIKPKEENYAIAKNIYQIRDFFPQLHEEISKKCYLKLPLFTDWNFKKDNNKLLLSSRFSIDDNPLIKIELIPYLEGHTDKQRKTFIYNLGYYLNETGSYVPGGSNTNFSSLYTEQLLDVDDIISILPDNLYEDTLQFILFLFMTKQEK